MKRIVVANTFAAWPPLTGGQRRVYFLARELSREFDVDLLVLDRAGGFKRLDFSESFREIRVPAGAAYLAELRKIKRRLKSANDLAYSRHWAKCLAYQEILAERLKDAAAVVTAHPYSAYAILAACGGRGVPMIYDAHNVEAHQKRDLLRDAGPEYEEIRRIEAAAVRESALTLACSKDDAETFVREYGAGRSKISVVGNGVDARAVPTLPSEEAAEVRAELGTSGKFVAIFAGSYHFPNFLGADKVVELAKALPDVVFLVLGSICRYAGLQGMLPRNLLTLGIVSESAKWIAFQTADVGLNPIEQGSGTNIKMFEYAAAGLAAVSTPFGARGVELNPGTEFIECDLRGFEATLRELKSAGRYKIKSMGARAKGKVAEVADWSVIGAGYLRTMRSLLKGP